MKYRISALAIALLLMGVVGSAVANTGPPEVRDTKLEKLVQVDSAYAATTQMRVSVCHTQQQPEAGAPQEQPVQACTSPLLIPAVLMVGSLNRCTGPPPLPHAASFTARLYDAGVSQELEYPILE